MKYVFNLLGLLILSQIAFAQDANQSLLISKLETVSKSLADKDESKVPIALRLADLYSERARKDAMNEIEKGCANSCGAGSADRAKALRLYNEVLPRVSEASKAKVIVQIGHLYQMSGQEAKALEFYQKVVQDKSAHAMSADLKSEANLSLAEIYFKKREYKNAHTHYQNVLNIPSSNSKGLASYRSAWCLFNLGDKQAATNEIEKILNTPNLLSKSTLNGDKSDINVQFHEEVSKDYATFLSQKNASVSDAKKLYQLSPLTTRQANIQYLAYELDRVGQKSASFATWQEAYKTMTNQEDKITAQLAMAQLNLDLQDKKSAINYFEKALTAITELKATDLKKCESGTNCDEYRKRARFFVVSWNQTEKKSASPELLQAYQLYLMNYKSDIEMMSFAVSAAVTAKNLDLAWTLQESIVDNFALSTAQTNALTAETNGTKNDSKTVAKSKIENKPDFLEKNLIQQLDLADSSGKIEYKNKAYDNYLKLSVQKTKLHEVLYQKAHQEYEKNNYQAASLQFHEIAMSKTADMKLRKQAADLALDALGILKNTAQIITYSSIYKNELGTNNQKDFSQVLQKSKLSESVELADKSTLSAYAALLEINVTDLDSADKIKFYKNKIILAEKNKKYSEAISAADSLAAMPGVSAEDKEFAFLRKAYLSELRLDFNAAFSATEKLAKTYTSDEKNLKLAIFSELAGESSEAYYKKYLQGTAQLEDKKLVAIDLIQKSKNKELEIQKQSAILEKYPEVYAGLLADAYSAQASPAIFKKISQTSSLKNTTSGKLVLRDVFLSELAQIEQKITQHNLDTNSDKKLVASIKARKSLLTQVEEAAKKAIETTDWSSQLIALNMLSKQSERFYNDIISAPLPKGLSPEEESQYLSLLSAQAMPYKNKAIEAAQKVDEFWKTPNWKSEYQKSLTNLGTRRLIENEMAAISKIATPAVQTELKSMMTVAPVTVATKPSIDEIKKTRQLVYNDPNNAASLMALRDLEKRSQNRAMVSYLENRIESLKKGL